MAKKKFNITIDPDVLEDFCYHSSKYGIVISMKFFNNNFLEKIIGIKIKILQNNLNIVLYSY